jgi:hypothetical protein
MTDYTVDTDGTSGDYSSLNAAIADLPDPFTDDITITCYATTSVDDSTAVDLSGLNTSASYRLYIEAGDSNYKLRASTGGGYLLDISGGFDTYTNLTIDGLHVAASAKTANYQSLVDISHRDGRSIIKNCIIETEAHTDREEVIRIKLSSSNYGGECVIVNNFIISDTSDTHPASRIFNFYNTNDVYIYNNTFVGADEAQAIYYAGDSTYDDGTVWYNNLLYNINAPYNSLSPGTADYNATDGAWDLGGANDLQSQSFTFVDASNGDYHLDSSDTGAIDNGTDLSSDGDYSFSDDYDGDTRSGTWDIGADEYVGGGGTTAVPVFLHHYKMAGGL